MDTQNDDLDILTQEEEVDTLSDVQEEDNTETVEELKARLQKMEEIVRNQKIRAEKAEAKAKTIKETSTPKKDNKDFQLSQSDLYSLIKGNVAEEDISEVTDYAKLKSISVSEALKSPFVKTLLKEKDEERKTAQVTNTGAAKRGISKISDDALLEKAKKGEFPDSDEDIMRLVMARRARKN